MPRKKSKNYTIKYNFSMGKEDLLLVAISYDKKTKKHTCHIEKMS